MGKQDDTNWFESRMLRAYSLTIGTLLLLAFIDGLSSQNWAFFCASSPFTILFFPSYFELLPKGGLTHGYNCTCAVPDAECELGFWFEHGQKALLALPPVLASIYLFELLIYHQSVLQAALHTIFAAFTALVLALVCALAVRIMVTKFNDS